MRKLGHIFCPTGEWSYASTPTAMHIGGDVYRVYFASRDRQNRGHIFSLEIDITHPTEWHYLRGPLLSPGERGSFDDSGLSPACVYESSLYYLGWNLGVTVPFRNSIGVAHILGNELMGHHAPLLDRSEHDPLTIAYPWVMGSMMWYGSNMKWGETNDDMQFVMKYATGDRGYWKPQAQIMALKEGEKAVVRPCVLKEEIFRMWYAIKGEKYSIGYAESMNGIQWNRIDNVGLKPSEGFDSEEVTYPCVFRHKGRLYMLYNGNHYGKTGFGIAVEG